MENKEITKKNRELVNSLLKNIENMKEADYKLFLEKLSQFHNYSLSNQIILFFNNCSQVAGYKTWVKLGRTVKKGSRAVWILAPSGIKTIIKNVKNKEGIIEQKKVTFCNFRSVPVFDISATEGEEVKKDFTTYSEVSYAEIEKVALKLGFTINKKPLEIALGGYIENKNIVLNSNLNLTENIGTLIHEISHGILGHTNSMDLRSKDLKEQEAETATFLLCKQLNINRKSEFYLKSFELSENIFKSFNCINKAVKVFLETLNEESKRGE